MKITEFAFAPDSLSDSRGGKGDTGRQTLNSLYRVNNKIMLTGIWNW